MDLFKKFLGLEQKTDDEIKRKKIPPINDEFRKPVWVEEYDTDDELFDSSKTFGVQIFTNPLEMQKQFEHQIQEMMKSLENYDENFKIFDQEFRDEYMKPGFELETRRKKALDADLDGEMYADQLNTLLQRISPEFKSLIPNKSDITTQPEPKVKKSDAEKVMDRIHGNVEEEVVPVRPRKRIVPPKYHEGVFEGTFQGPRMFGQSIISQTVRKPDGSYETRKTVRDSEGHSKTTVTRSKNGQTEVLEAYGGEEVKTGPKFLQISDNVGTILKFDCNHYYTKNGYTLPKNLW